MSKRGFTFNGRHSDSYGLIWSELPIDIFAISDKIDFKSEKIAGLPGAIPHGFNIKPREFRTYDAMDRQTSMTDPLQVRCAWH